MASNKSCERFSHSLRRRSAQVPATIVSPEEWGTVIVNAMRLYLDYGCSWQRVKNLPADGFASFAPIPLKPCGLL